MLLGEGQTAQVLRNLCHQLLEEDGEEGRWAALASHIEGLFGDHLLPPEHVVERGEITMSYRDGRSQCELDLSSSGRGMQQTLLLLAYLYANPQAVLLLDEPDAHLEILRQRQTYRLIRETAENQGCQIIAASHSEVVLNEAAGSDTVVAFVGRPRRIDGRGSQVLEALQDIGFEDYYQAELQGWVLYLEGSSDLAILQAFAAVLDHHAAQYLDSPFVRYVGNVPDHARKHFFGLREAKPDLVGVALFDHIDGDALRPHEALHMLQWEKREIENYLCRRDVLVEWARGQGPVNLWSARQAEVMGACIDEIEEALRTLDDADPWSDDVKATDQVLDRVFRKYYETLGLPILRDKSDYHELARFLTPDMLPDEVDQKLDAIVEVAEQARPRGQ